MKLFLQSKGGSDEGIFYGWVIVASSVIIMATVYGVRHSYGVFFKALEGDFGLTRAATSGVFSAYMVLCALFALVGGWAFDRYGPRTVVALSGFITGLGLVLTSRINDIWQLYLTYSVFLALGTGAVYTIVMATGSRWFERGRGLALGIIGSGIGLGPVIIAPAANYFISHYSWRISFLMLGLVSWVFIITMGLFLKEPSATRAASDENTSNQKAKSQGGSSPKEHKIDSAVFFAFRAKEFWLLFLIWFCYAFVLHLVMTHVVPRATDAGISSASAATIISFIGGFSILGRLTMGRVSDLFGRRGTSIVCALLQALALLWLIKSDKMWMFYLFAVAYGFGYGGLDPPVVALVSEIFGFSHLGTIMGALVIGWGIGAAIGPLLTGYIFDVKGGYSLAFLCGAMLMLLTMLFIFPLKTSERRERGA